jgi:DNA-binding NarL/FixJ family response regulator
LTRWRFDNVRASFAVPEHRLRDPLFQTLRSHGLRNQFEAHTAEGLHTCFKSGEMDLIITMPEVMGGNLGPTLQNMRHSRLGDNPFAVVVTLVENSEPELVRHLIDAGADDVLLLPVSPAQVLERLDGFVVGRKPFMVTHDYVGPDRRNANRPDAQPTASIEVPNPMRCQVIPNAHNTPLAEQIRKANERINVHKMKCYATQISYLAEQIVKDYNRSDGHDDMLAHAVGLGAVAEDLALRMSQSGFAHAGELASSLCALCDRLGRADRRARDVEVGILPTLTRAIQRIFDEDPLLLSWVDTVEAR